MCLLCFYLRINNMDDFGAPVAEHRTPNMVLINTTPHYIVHGLRYQKDAKTVVSFYFTKLSTIWLWYHIHVWKRLMCVPGKNNFLKSSATSVITLTHM